MSTSYTTSTANTFTVVHARDMAAKVSTDLKRMQRLYGLPSDAAIAAYETEVVELLRRGYLGTAFYGFRRDGKWIEPTLRYTAHELAAGEVVIELGELWVLFEDLDTAVVVDDVVACTTCFVA